MREVKGMLRKRITRCLILGPRSDLTLVVEELCEDVGRVVPTEGTGGTEKSECSGCSREDAVSEGEVAGEGTGAGEGVLLE